MTQDQIYNGNRLNRLIINYREQISLVEQIIAGDRNGIEQFVLKVLNSDDADHKYIIRHIPKSTFKKMLTLLIEEYKMHLAEAEAQFEAL